MAVQTNDEIKGTEKEFLDLFNHLCYSRTAWQVWSDLMSAMACTIANVFETNPKRKADREKEYERCIKELGGDVEIPAKLFAIVTMALENNPDQDFPVYDFPTYAGTYKIYIENGKAVFENLFTEESFSSSDPVVCAAIQDRSFSALEYGNIQFNASGTACALAYRQDLVLLDFAKRTIEHRRRLYDVTVRWAGDDFLCTFFDDSVDILRV